MNKKQVEVSNTQNITGSAADKKDSNTITQKEPIAAIATPVGEGGIAVIRVSGKNSIELVDSIFRGKDLADVSSHTVHFGKILNQNRVVDEVLATVFRSPKSYTGEDAVEISCHGGVLVTQEVLETILTSNVRAAEPGEFTERAFLNGKMDLSQAEAVADLIHAKSKKAVDAANQQLEGQLGEHVRNFRQDIIDATALVELELDFSEEDVEFADYEHLKELLTDLDREIDRLLETYETGRLVKHGVKTVFVGLPNAGKSTLLNTLLGKERAIVTKIAGTTRDTIDADWSYEGLRFTLTDTAGMRQTDDVIEAEGVKRSQKAIEEADLVVYLNDLSRALTQEEQEMMNSYRKEAGNTPFILVGTKWDIEMDTEEQRLDYDLKISALEQQNIDPLKKLMKERVLEGKQYDSTSTLVTSSRHRNALNETQKHLRSALQGIDQQLPGDLLSIDLRSALKSLGEITGEITTEDLLDSIFSRFCIGK